METEEYEGVQWIGGEAFYQSKKKKKKFTREDHLYGVFAEDEFTKNEQTGAPRKSRKFANSTEFVSSGLYQPGLDELSKTDVEVSKPRPAPVKPDETVKIEEKQDQLPTAFGEKIREGAERRRTAEKEQEEVKRAWREAGSSGFAAFEKHSRGVASKLMQKMGYKPGEGLGARKQGMVEPIVQKIRPKSMGMGYGDFKEQEPDTSVQSEEPVLTETRRSTKKESVPRLWKQKSAKERIKRQFKTPIEVLQESENAFSQMKSQTIIDMRNPQTKLITDLSQIGSSLDNTNADDAERKPLPELEHNMELLVDLTETRIRDLDSSLKSKEDTITLLDNQETELSQKLIEQSEQLERLNDFHHEIQQLHELHEVEPDTLLENCLDLKSLFPAEFVQYNVSALILQKIVLHFENLFHDWKPLLDDSGQRFEELRRWKMVLDLSKTDADAESEDSTNAYTQLIIHTLLPPLRATIVNEWNPKMPEVLLRLLEKWRPLIPTLVLQHVCQVLVYPKLKEAVEQWDPCQEKVALHVWIHPWLLLMNQQLMLLYPIIITKFINALQSWHASDSSALVLLSPWKCVFSEQDWDNLLTKAILPKLGQALMEYDVNPLKHNLDCVEWVVRWQYIIPQQHLVNLLNSIFFPKWLRVLHHWLTHNANFEEVSNWYVSWKSAFPNEIQSSAKLTSRFGCALNLMNTAVEGRTLPSIDVVLGTEKEQQRPSPVFRPTPKTIFTLRDLVQKFAEDNNISFVPKPGRLHEGLQVYGFGMVSIILDNVQNAVKAHTGGAWKAVSLEELYVETQRRQS
eukprot:g5258.t1